MQRIRNCCTTLIFFLLVAMPITFAHNEKTKVELPQKLKQYVIESMRQKLAAFDEIMDSLAQDNLHHASQVAEQYLGPSTQTGTHTVFQSYMPAGMRHLDDTLAAAATHFSEVAQTGDTIGALSAFKHVSSSCILCHSAYRF